MEKKIKLNELALSCREGTSRFSLGESLYLGHICDEKTVSSQEIKLTTLDKYCDINEIHHIDVLKIDVEGHEPEVIEGAKNTLADKKVDIIFLEVHPSLGEFYQSLALLDYDFFYYDYMHSSLVPVLDVFWR